MARLLRNCGLGRATVIAAAGRISSPLLSHTLSSFLHLSRSVSLSVLVSARTSLLQTIVCVQSFDTHTLYN